MPDELITLAAKVLTRYRDGRIQQFKDKSGTRMAHLVLINVTGAVRRNRAFPFGGRRIFRVPQNFNEGWNAYFARAAYAGPLYFPYDAPVTNNYPPLSFYLIGGLALLGGDPIYIGRFISGVSLLVVAVDIFAILAAARRRSAGGGNRSLSPFSASSRSVSQTMSRRMTRSGWVMRS